MWSPLPLLTFVIPDGLGKLDTATYQTSWIFAFTRIYESARSVERCQVQSRGRDTHHLVTVPRQQPVRSHIMRRCRNAKSAPDPDPFKPFQSQIVGTGMFLERRALLQAKTPETDYPETLMSSRTWPISWFMALVSAAVQPGHALYVVNVTLLLVSIALS